MNNQKHENSGIVLAIILVLVGLVVLGFVSGRQIVLYGFDLGVIGVSISTSLIAAGIVLYAQLKLLGDPNHRIENQLQQVLVRKLPTGVSRLFLSIDEAPSFDQLLRDCKRVTFFGPGGALVLSCVADEAVRRSKANRIILEMFLPENPLEIAENLVRPDFKTYTEWDEAISKARLLQSQGKLQLNILRVSFEPTISALQIDDSYYQATMLFPLVSNKRRPTLALEGATAKNDYFQPLWTFLRDRVTQN